MILTYNERCCHCRSAIAYIKDIECKHEIKTKRLEKNLQAVIANNNELLVKMDKMKELADTGRAAKLLMDLSDKVIEALS